MAEKKRVGGLLFYMVLAFGSLFLFSGCATFHNLVSVFTGESVKHHIPEQYSSGGSAQFQAGGGLPSENAERFYRLARHFQKKGRHRIAVEEFLKVLKINPEHYKAHNALGVSYDHLKQFETASVCYRAALRINPKLDYVYNNIGYSNLLQGDLEGAAEAFQKAAALNGQKKLYKNNLALVRVRQGIYEPTIMNDSDSEERYVDSKEAELSQNKGLGDSPENIEPIVRSSSDYRNNKNTFYTIQLGVYYIFEKARMVMEDACSKGFGFPHITRIDRGKGFKPYYRVRAGKFSDKSNAEQMASTIKGRNGKPAFAVVDTFPLNNLYSEPEKKCGKMAAGPEVIKTNCDIEVLNGNGVNHMARRFSSFLKQKGFEVRDFANASHFHYPETIIYYSPGYYQKARILLQEVQKLKVCGTLAQATDRENAIQVLLGKDLISIAEKLKNQS